MRKIVGMCGAAGSGKDTLADFLVREHGFVKLAWAGPLKAGLAAMGLPEPADRDDKEKMIPGFDFTWRQAAQRLGTEFGRALDANIWVKMVSQQIEKSPMNARFVFSDCRFENETAAVRNLGGKIVFVLGRRADLGDAAQHESEMLPIFHPEGDGLIDNSRDLQNSYDQLKNTLGL